MSETGAVSWLAAFCFLSLLLWAQVMTVCDSSVLHVLAHHTTYVAASPCFWRCILACAAAW